MGFPIDVPTGDENVETAPALSPDQLAAQLASANERIAEQDQDLARERTRLDSFLKGSPPASKQELAPIPPMPDPLEAPDAYRQWLVDKDARQTKEYERRLQAHTDQIQESMDSAEARATIWQEFQTRYPKYAERRDLAGAAYSALIGRNALPKTAVEVVDKVKAEMDRMVGTSIDSISKPADRSAGTSAGERPAPKSPPGPAGDDDSVTMHTAISDFKIKHGLI